MNYEHLSEKQLKLMVLRFENLIMKQKQRMSKEEKELDRLMLERGRVRLLYDKIQEEKTIH